MEFLTILIHIIGLFVYTTAWTPLRNEVPGVPDARELKVKTSRGSGTGLISFGFAVVVLAAFAFFAVLLGLVLFYKREKGIRNKEKTLYLTTF